MSESVEHSPEDSGTFRPMRTLVFAPDNGLTTCPVIGPIVLRGRHSVHFLFNGVVSRWTRDWSLVTWSCRTRDWSHDGSCDVSPDRSRDPLGTKRSCDFPTIT